MLFEQIQEVVAEHLDCDKEEITRESTFESLGIDSLDAVELVMERKSFRLDELDMSYEIRPKPGILIPYLDYIQLDLDRDLENIDELVKFVEEKMEG